MNVISTTSVSGRVLEDMTDERSNITGITKTLFYFCAQFLNMIFFAVQTFFIFALYFNVQNALISYTSLLLALPLCLKCFVFAPVSLTPPPPEKKPSLL